VDSEFVAAFCLSESVDPSILVDLVLNFNVGEGAHTITSCSPPASVNGCNALYFCNVTPDFDGPACLIDIRCSDGTLIDSCTGQSSCFLT
jgi:hypothetical protein